MPETRPLLKAQWMFVGAKNMAERNSTLYESMQLQRLFCSSVFMENDCYYQIHLLFKHRRLGSLRFVKYVELLDIIKTIAKPQPFGSRQVEGSTQICLPILLKDGLDIISRRKAPAEAEILHSAIY